MPTYDYRCATCGGRFETFQSITSDSLATCTLELCQSENPEERGKGEVRRIVSGGAGVVFKGEGFYLTDYARKGKGKEKGKKSGEDKTAKRDSADSSTGNGKSGETSKDSGSGKDAGGKGSADTSSD